MRIPLHVNEDVLTGPEVSAYLKIPLSTLYSLTKQGKIKGVKVGKHWRYLRRRLEEYLLGETQTERRRVARLNTAIKGRLEVRLSEKLDSKKEGEIRNLSEGGALFVYSTQAEGPEAELHDPVSVSFPLSEKDSSALELRGRVVHLSKNSGSRVGIKFKDLTPEAKEALRNYVG